MKSEIEVLNSRSETVIDSLSELTDIKGILCFGSYAMGTFDQYSDIDLYTFCHPKIITSSERQKAFEKINGIGDLQINHENIGWDNQWAPVNDCFQLNGIQFDLTFNTVDWIRTVVRKVKDQGATSIPELKFRLYTMLGLLENSVVLYDPESVLQDIISELHPYPSKLRQDLLSQNIPIVRNSLEDLKDYVQRNIGNSSFHFHLGRVIDSTQTILFALNGRYDPATKRIEKVFSDLKIVPKNFARRYGKILETPLTHSGRKEIVSELQTLGAEIEILADEFI